MRDSEADKGEDRIVLIGLMALLAITTVMFAIVLFISAGGLEGGA